MSFWRRLLTRGIWVQNMLKTLFKLLAVALLYLLFGLSLGCYYTATYFGRSGWVLPSCETISGIILYYFSVVNARTEIQAVHWMVSFLVAGYLWIGVLWVVSNKFVWSVQPNSEEKGRTTTDRFASFGLAVALSTIALSVPVLFMVWWMGATDPGFSWSRFIAVCLRQEWVTPPIWLNYVYCALATVGLVAQIAVVRNRWTVGGKRLFRMFALACALLFLISISAGLILAFPLRALLIERMHW